MTTRERIVGRPIFEASPDNPNDPEATGVGKVRESIEHVVAHRQPHTMAVQKYDIPGPTGGFEERIGVRSTRRCSAPVARWPTSSIARRT